MFQGCRFLGLGFSGSASFLGLYKDFTERLCVLKSRGLGQSFGCLAVALMSLLEFRGLSKSKLDDPGESGLWILGFGLGLRVWGVRV